MRQAKKKAGVALKRVYQRRLRENQTKAELYLWEAIKDKQLGEKFTPQAIVQGFIPDFWCGRLRLVIEVDGSVHLNQRNYDLWREKILTRYKVKVIRFTNEQVLTSRDWCVEKIKLAIRTQQERRHKKPLTLQPKPKPARIKCPACGGWAYLFEGQIGPHLLSGKGWPCPNGAQWQIERSLNNPPCPTQTP